MATFTVYNDFDAASIKAGQTIYPVRRTHIHCGTERVELRTQPGRKNLSNEVCTRGWLGTTDDVSADALGMFEVVSIRERWLGDGRQRVDVKVR